MKQIQKVLGAVVALALLAGCAAPAATPAESAPPAAQSAPAQSEAAQSEAAAEPGGAAVFSFSDGIDERGYWQGVTALEHVELFDYQAMEVPADACEITDEQVRGQMDKVLEQYTVVRRVTDRAVADGDTVNIDFVGRMDGVEFDGGNTGGAGTEVTLGVTDYIDGFLEQLVGRLPGETFDLYVTFPADYGLEEFNGKDAVFTTTVNHIVETDIPALTDEFVAETLSPDFGWADVAGMEAGVRADLRAAAIKSWLQSYLMNEVPVRDVPQSLLDYMEASMVHYYEGYADGNDYDTDVFLSLYEAVPSMDALLDKYRGDNTQMAKYYLVLQAVAEDMGAEVQQAEVEQYLEERAGPGQVEQSIEQYGLPYWKQMVLHQQVLDAMVATAVTIP